RQDLEFLHGFNRGLNQDRVKGVFVVPDSIDQPSVSVGLAAQGVIVRSCLRVEGAGSGEVFTLLPRGDAGDEIDKLSKVSAVQRKAADRGSGDHLAELGALRFHQRYGRGDGDGL